MILAHSALEKVESLRAVNPAQGGYGVVIDPTQRADIFCPARDRVIRRALKRAAQRRAFRIKFDLFFLDLRKFYIDVRYARLRGAIAKFW